MQPPPGFFYFNERFVVLLLGQGRVVEGHEIFGIGYFLFQIPGAAYAQRKSATRLIFFALISWGAAAALTGVIREFWLLALDRFLLGVAESAIFPAILILQQQGIAFRGIVVTARTPRASA